MPFPQRLLHRHEEVALDLHPHWSYYATPLLVLVVGVAGGVATLAATSAGTTERTALTVASLVVLAGSILWVVVRYLKWVNTHLVITTDRLVFRTGIVTKRGVEVPLDRVNAVHFRQGIVQRMIGAGDLTIESGGDDGQLRFTDVRRPADLQRTLYEQMDAVQRRRLAAAGVGQRDVAAQLERLEGMLERGTLSRNEFEAHKDRLLRS